MRLCMQLDYGSGVIVMRYREPFTVYPRRLPSGRIVYYYQTYDDQGEFGCTQGDAGGSCSTGSFENESDREGPAIEKHFPVPGYIDE